MGIGWLVPVLNLLDMGAGPVVDTTVPSGRWLRDPRTLDRAWTRDDAARTLARDPRTSGRTWTVQPDA